jgi:hypothetical protein
MYRAVGILGNITKLFVLTGCIEWVQHMIDRQRQTKYTVRNVMASGANGVGLHG